MKKNRMMRLASILMIAVLMTTCTISGTFAKYVTEASATDTARVAKWGVGITTSGALFSEQYKDEPIVAIDDATITVQVYEAASVEQNVVAPGTQNSDGLTFTLTGRPEVDVAVKVALDVTDIKLAAANDTYLDYTTGNDLMDTFDLAADYYPIVFTLKNGVGTELESGTLAEIETYLEALSKTYDSNTDLSKIATDTDGTYNLTWAWEFESGHDEADTFLGNESPLQTVEFGITITATQVN